MSGPEIDRRHLLMGLCFAGTACAGTLQAPTLRSGSKARLVFTDWSGPALPVWTYRPTQAGPHSPLVFVMHGQGRNAEEYRDQWAPVAEAARLNIAVPEFSRADFPDARSYNQGNRYSLDGALMDQALWSFSALEPMFDTLRMTMGLTASQYSIYGHSAGAQFVHRFLLFEPAARVHRAVSANAGWYTMPDPNIPTPFGLEGEGISDDQVSNWLARPLTILLGTADTDMTQSSLNRSPEAMVQGRHRLDRGRTFLEAGRVRAEALAVPLGWRLAYAPGVAHDNTRMAPHAVAHLEV